VPDGRRIYWSLAYRFKRLIFYATLEYFSQRPVVCRYPFVRRRTASFTYREDSATRFVEDDGPGIDPEDIARLLASAALWSRPSSCGAGVIGAIVTRLQNADDKGDEARIADPARPES
jgi:hypothetical protein